MVNDFNNPLDMGQKIECPKIRALMIAEQLMGKGCIEVPNADTDQIRIALGDDSFKIDLWIGMFKKRIIDKHTICIPAEMMGDNI